MLTKAISIILTSKNSLSLHSPHKIMSFFRSDKTVCPIIIRLIHSGNTLDGIMSLTFNYRIKVKDTH